ncbi:MAG: ATP-binding protein [Candidatus Caldarchaeum sp.]
MHIEELNPWWKTATVNENLAPPKHRDLFKTLSNGLFRKYIQVVVGLRRVGKSTLMFQLIKQLINQGTNPLRIVYISFDDPEARQKGVVGCLKDFTELTGENYRTGALYLFVDEAQKYPEWASEVKLLYDNYKNIRFVVSGSAGLNLLSEAKRSLAGRALYHELKPLSFEEYLLFVGSKVDVSKPRLYSEELKREFERYVKRPFPEIVHEVDEAFIKTYVRESVLDPVLFKDIPLQFREVDVLLVESLLRNFLTHPGTYLSVDSLSRDMKRAKTTIYKCLFYLEASLLIRRVMNFRPSTRSVSRKLARVYPYHPVLMLPYNPSDDKYAESLAAATLEARHYWREDDIEVDFLLDDTPVEVKYVSEVRQEDLRSVKRFMNKYGSKTGVVVTKNKEGVVDGVRLVPLWLLCLRGGV